MAFNPGVLIVPKILAEQEPGRAHRAVGRPPIIEVPEIPPVTVKNNGERFGHPSFSILLKVDEPPEENWDDLGVKALRRAISEAIDRRFLHEQVYPGVEAVMESFVRDLLVRWSRMGILGRTPEFGLDGDVWRFDADVAVDLGLLPAPIERVWVSKVIWITRASAKVPVALGLDPKVTELPQVNNRAFPDPSVAFSYATPLVEPDALVVVQDTMIHYTAAGAAYRDTWFSNDGDDFWLWRRYKDGRNRAKRPSSSRA